MGTRTRSERIGYISRPQPPGSVPPEVGTKNDGGKTYLTKVWATVCLIVAIFGGGIFGYPAIRDLINAVFPTKPGYNLVLPFRDSLEFIDVNENDWHYEVVNHLTSRGIGDSAENIMFDPDGYITYEQLSYWLIKTLGISRDNSSHETMTYDQCLKEAQRQKIIPPRYYSQNVRVTRNDAATMILRTLSVIEKDSSLSKGNNVYAGLSTPTKIFNKDANREMILLTESGVIWGDTNAENLRPTDFLTRAEAAQMLYQVYTRLHKLEN